MLRRFNLLFNFSGGCGETDVSHPELIKCFEISGGPEISQEEINIRIVSYIKANPDEFMKLWEILADLHDSKIVDHNNNLPEFFIEWLKNDLDHDNGEALMNLMGLIDDVDLLDLQSLVINSSIDQEGAFCFLQLFISLIEIPIDAYAQLD